jgi:hypothetical protein
LRSPMGAAIAEDDAIAEPLPGPLDPLGFAVPADGASDFVVAPMLGSAVEIVPHPATKVPRVTRTDANASERAHRGVRPWVTLTLTGRWVGRERAD